MTSLFFKRIKKVFNHGVVHLLPDGKARGNVLLSYITFPFVAPEQFGYRHTNYWECRQIAKTFTDRGYAVDVIDWTNTSFIPRKRYSYCIDIHANMERLASLLNADCIKILHITGAHWLFQNEAEYARLLALQKRRGVTLLPRRTVHPTHAIEHADYVTVLGNTFTQSTYAYAKKKLFHIPLSTTHTFDFPARDWNTARKQFVWFGGAGMVHKGLDLVLEAFATMPEYELVVCGPISSEPDFEEEYRQELYFTRNIKTLGRVDPGGEEFSHIMRTTGTLIHPSCSEGGGGAVITCMHAGIIPAVSFESSVDVDDFGFVLGNGTVEDVQFVVRAIASLPATELEARAREAWKYARAHHTRETFAAAYEEFVKMLESEQEMRNGKNHPYKKKGDVSHFLPVIETS